jgi:hypothetical protein
MTSYIEAYVYTFTGKLSNANILRFDTLESARQSTLEYPLVEFFIWEYLPQPDKKYKWIRTKLSSEYKWRELTF